MKTRFIKLKKHLKRSIILAVGIILLHSNCKNETPKVNSNELPISTVQNPRSAQGIDSVALANMGTLSFEDTLHNFGLLKEGGIVEYDFAYTNTGKSDLLISTAKSTCGCTAPDFKREPIKAGESGSIKVKFNSTGKHDEVRKTVTITTNGNPSEYYVTIEATVRK